MIDPLTYSPYIWPVIGVGFLITLSVYSWRHRQIPGARWFALALMFSVPWVTGAVFELAASDVIDKHLWMKFQTLWMLPVVTLMFCFVLEYAGLGHWLNRRTLSWLAVPPLLMAGLIITNDWHHSFWLPLPSGGNQLPPNGVAGWFFLIYAYLLGLVGLLIFIRLFIRAPQQRWPVALIIIGQVLTRGAFLIEMLDPHLQASLGPTIPSFVVTNSLYALALFGFHMFDPIPVARQTAILQMREGMIVLDSKWVIVDLNPAAKKILGITADRARGREISTILSACPELVQRLAEPEAALSEISLESCQAARYFNLHLSHLKDKQNRVIGHLLLLHDITEQRLAHAQLLEQQRMVATLQERERLARELHDNAGQVLGYVSMQAQAIRQWVHEGNDATAEDQLTRLAEVAQDAHGELRESIFSLKSGSVEGWSFLEVLRLHLESYHSHYGIATELELPGGLDDSAFKPEEGVQLLRVIQEALTNAHRHGKASSVRVSFALQDGCVQIVVADDGCGFDATRISTAPSDHFGLVFMQERMQQIGGSLSFVSHTGAGTQVILTAPITDTS